MDVGSLRAILQLDDSQYNARMDKAEQRFLSFGKGGGKAKIEVEAAGAIKEVTELGQAMKAITNKTVTVKVDTQGQIAQVTALGNAIKQTQAAAQSAARSSSGVSKWDSYQSVVAAQRAAVQQGRASTWSPEIGAYRLQAEADKLQAARGKALLNAQKQTHDEMLRDQQRFAQSQRQAQENLGNAMAQTLERQLKQRKQLTDRFGNLIAENQVKSIESKIEDLQRKGYYQVAAGGTLTAAFTAPAAALGAGVVKFTGDYQETMQHIITLTDVSRGELDGLKKSVLELSSDPRIRQGPEELADALYYVTSTGLKGADGMKVLKAAALGASAGLGDTQVVANTLTTVLDAYGLSADKAGRAVDTLTEAVRFGKGEADKYAAAFPKVIAIAAQAGVSFEEVAAQMASATRVGLSPSETASALRQIFNNLIDPSEKARRAMKEMGTSVEELRASLRDKGLFNTLKDLQTRTGGRIGPITELFGSIRAMTGFLATTGTGTLQEYQKTLQSIREANGTTATAAEIASETFQFQMDKFLSTLERVGIELGTKYLPALTQYAKQLGTDLPAAVETVVATWNDLPPVAQKGVIAIGGILALSGPLLLMSGTVKILAAALMQIGSFVLPAGALGGIGALLANPVVVGLLTGTALVGGAIAWQQFSASMNDAVVAAHNLSINAENIGKSFERALSVASGNNNATKLLKELQQAVTDAGDDVPKLASAFKKLTDADYEIKKLGLSPMAEKILMSQFERIKRDLESRRIEINVEPGQSWYALESLKRAYMGEDYETRGPIANLWRAGTAPARQLIPAFYGGLNSAAQSTLRGGLNLATGAATEIGRFVTGYQPPRTDLSLPTINAVNESALPGGLPWASMSGTKQIEKNAKKVVDVSQQAVGEIKKYSDIVKELNRLNNIAAVREPTFAEQNRYTDLKARRDQIDSDAKAAAAAAKRRAADAAADAAAAQRQAAEETANRLRAISIKQLQDILKGYEGIGNAVEGVIGRIYQLEEAGSKVGEKTVRAKMEAELLKRQYDGVPEPLKRAAVELAGIEFRMKKLLDMRDGFRELFAGMFKGMTTPQAKEFAAMVDDFGKSLNLGGQFAAQQARARQVATPALRAVERERSGIGSQIEALQYAGHSHGSTNAADAYGNANRYNPGGAVLKQIADSVNTPMGAAACARFVGFAFDRMGIAVQKSDVAGQLVKNALRAGAKEIPVSQAGAGDLIYQHGRGYGVLKDAQGMGYHVGVGIGNGRMAAKNRNYVGPVWQNARALDTSALAGGVPALGQIPAGSAVADRIANIPQLEARPPRKVTLPGAIPFDPRIGRIATLGKGWGGYMADHVAGAGENTSFRAAMEQLLLQQGGGAVFTQAQQAKARGIANTADFNASVNQATQNARERIRDMSREIRLLGQENNPIAALFEGFEHGSDRYLNANPKAFEALLSTTINNLLAHTEQATKEFRRGAMRAAQLANETAPSLSGDFNSEAYDRSKFAASTRFQVWDSADIRGQLQAADKLDEAGKKAEAARVRRNTNITAQNRIDAAVAQDAAQRQSDAAVAYGKLREEQGKNLKQLEYENALLQTNTLSREGQERALALYQARLAATDALRGKITTAEPGTDEYGAQRASGMLTPQEAASAIQRSVDDAGNAFDLGKGKEKTTAQQDYNAELQRTLNLLESQRRIYLTTAPDSKKQREELEFLQIRNNLLAKYNQYMSVPGDISTMLDADRQRFNAEETAERRKARAGWAASDQQTAAQRRAAANREAAMSLLQERQQFAGQFNPSHRAALERELALRDAGAEYDRKHGNDLNALTPNELRDQSANDARKRAAADELDLNERIVDYYERRKQLELDGAASNVRRLEIEQKYTEQLRKALGLQTDAVTVAKQQAEMADAAMRDNVEIVRSRAQEMRDILSSNIKKGFTDPLEGIKGFFSDVTDRILTDMSDKLADNLTNKLYRQGYENAGGQGDVIQSRAPWDTFMDIIRGRNPKTSGAPIPAGITGIAGAISPAGLFGGGFKPNAQQAPIAAKSELMSAVQSIIGGASINVATANFTIASAQQTIASATQNIAGVIGGNGGGAGSRPSTDQLISGFVGIAGGIA